MKRLWICALCLAGFLIAGRSLHAQSPSSQAPGAAAAVSTADFLASLQPPASVPVEPQPLLFTSCNALQCKSNCICGRGCHSFCNLTQCTCGCQQDTTGGPPCQV